MCFTTIDAEAILIATVNNIWICDDPESNHPKNQHVLVGILDQNGLLQMIAQPVDQIDSTPLKNQGSYLERTPSMNCSSSRCSSSMLVLF